MKRLFPRKGAKRNMCGFIVGLGVILNFLSWLWSVLWPALGYITGAVILLCLIGGIADAIKKRNESGVSGRSEAAQFDEREEAKQRLYKEYLSQEITPEEFQRRIAMLPGSVKRKRNPWFYPCVIGIITAFAALFFAFDYNANARLQEESRLLEERRLQAEQERGEEIRRREQEAAEHARQMEAILPKPSPSSSSKTSSAAARPASKKLTRYSTLAEWRRASRGDKLALAGEFMKLYNITGNTRDLVNGLDSTVETTRVYDNDTVDSFVVKAIGMVKGTSPSAPPAPVSRNLTRYSTIAQWKRASRSDKMTLCREFMRIYGMTGSAGDLVFGIDEAAKVSELNNETIDNVLQALVLMSR